MTKTATKTTEPSTPEPAVERIIPVIDPIDVELDWEGFVTKKVIVKAPDDLTLDDLGNHPEIWKKLQLSRTNKVLAEDDEVVIKFFEFTIHAVVDFADGVSAQLCKQWHKRDKRVRDRRPWSDENYYVMWTKDGYAYFRKSDDQRMNPSEAWDRWQSARDACSRQMYSPRLVG